ncbi:MAG: BspA family leucine-rich repeat surface protein [Clostridia bacterium]|nr:BspA family leucine-rich repeat surface protein [Clostridia bacterium]
MEKAKSQNKKLIYAVVGLAFALFAVLGALIGVFAATSQSITTGFNINYTVGDNVAAAIRTEAYVPNSGNAASTIITDKDGNEVDNENGYVVFNAPDESVPASVYIGDFSLTPTTPQLEFYFTIENKLETGYVQAVVGKNCTTQNNMTVKTYYYNTDSFTSTNSATTIDESLWKTNAHVPNAVAGGYKMVKVVLSVDDVNKAAACAGDIKITLNYSDVDKNISYPSIDAITSVLGAGYSQLGSMPGLVLDYACNNTSYQTTGTDVSYAGDGSIWAYYENGNIYILSNQTMALAGDCTGVFSSGHPALVINNIDTSAVTNMYRMFSGYTGTILDLSLFDTSSVTDMSYMFNFCNSLTSLDLSTFETSSVTDMSYMFNFCNSLTSLDLSTFETSSVTNMSRMFASCSSLTSIGLSSFDTSSVTDMSYMFGGCSSLTSLDLSTFDTSSVTNMSQMFFGCNSLTSLDLSTFDTSSVTSMSSMFYSYRSLTSIDLSSFDSSSVTNMLNMFSWCEKLTSLDLSTFDTASVTNMENMFSYCYSLTSLDLSSFDTSSVTNMLQMFYYCTNLKTIYVIGSWSTAAVANSSNMFYGCTNLVGQSGVVYSASNIGATMANWETGYLTLKTA